MTIKVTFEFDTAEAAVQFLARGLQQPGLPMPVKIRRTRTPRPEMVAENGAPEPVVVETAPPPAPVKAAEKAPNAPVKAIADATLDAVRGALREVFNTKGAAAATEVLKQFGAARVGEVKTTDYAAFIAACGK